MSLINKWLQRLISLKGVVLIGALVLVPGTFKPEFVSALDRWYYQLSQRLSSPAPLHADIALIELEAESLLALQRDPAQSDLLPLLLNPQAQIGIIMPTPMRESAVAAERLLNWFDKSQALPEAVAAWQQRNHEYQQLQARIQQGDVLVGLTQSGVAAFPEQAYPQVWQDRFDWASLTWLPEPAVAQMHTWLRQRNDLRLPDWPVDPRLQGAGYRATDTAPLGGPRQLIWLEESQIHPDLALALYLRQIATNLSVKEEPTVRFQGGYRLDMAHISQPMGRDGAVWVPTAVPGLTWVSQAQALAQPPAQPLWLLGTDRAQLTQVAATIVALQHQYADYQPYWNHWLHGVLVLLAAGYLLWIQPRLRPAMALMTLAIVLITGSAFQVAWQLSYQQVLPVPGVLLWFSVGAVLMLVWRQRRRQWTLLQWEHHNLSYQLAQQWYQQGRMDEAVAALRSCRSTEAVVTLLYDIAVQLERKRQYQEAARTYQGVVTRKPKFKDARKRAEALLHLSEPTQVVTDFSATHSLVMPSQDVNKPILGRYEIERELGRGAMGVVYLGMDPKIARRVAIKTLSYREFDAAQLPDIKERFFREAEAAGRLNHPNIVTVYDVGEETDLAFIAMDYVDGKSLDRYVSSSALLPIEEVYNIIVAVADALDYAHHQQIVHRDIKPSNIMYDANSGQIKVADFGIARIVDDSKTKTGDMLGSPVYMSPEQLKGTKVNGASDIYSLGVTLYQLLTGTLPFTGDSIANLAYQILNKKYTPVRELRPELSAGVVRIVNKALQKEPSKRYSNAAEMADAMRGLLAREFGRRDLRRENRKAS